MKNKGVFEFPENCSIKKVLEETGNWPEFDFFTQIGGGASGEIFLPKELDMSKRGAASITIFNRKKTDPIKLMRFWAKFYAEENCDKCTPCREGSMRILEMIEKKKIDYKKMNELIFSLEKTSFCPLGKGMANPYRTLIAKILKK